MKLKTRIILIVSLIVIGTFFSSYYILESNLSQAGKLIVEFENEFARLEGLTPRAERILYDFHKIIKIAEYLAKIKIAKGYEPLEKIVKNLSYREETEMIYEEAYEALGYLGRFEQKAVDLLISEFNPNADPVRAMNVLVGLNLAGCSEIVAGSIEKMKPFMSQEEIAARLRN